ncbi:F-box domain-containing protein [Citrus sinensis]|uniref:F-box domain-containing protein n=1 Tax=Citrus clementina TaxID=85681 RepID=V4U3B6_CITCL|nr:F-box protein SKIP14 [Citrus x clementina]XP_006469976.1 F-box protein SKIP14 [Citrus sinensis]ESR60402.1 hypothetical protein CICLE_v10015170mg [Citrus x clementina]KAH9743698.1 F-box domain-containing protein [Citrus sinensis]
MMNCGDSKSFSSLDKESESGNRDCERMENTELKNSYFEEACSCKVADDDDNNNAIELPVDPFDMGKESRFNSITGCFEKYWKDLCVFDEKDLEDLCFFEMDEFEISDLKHFSGFNFVWNGTMRVQKEKGILKYDEIYSSFSQYEISNGDCDDGFASSGNVNNGVVGNENKGDDLGCGEGGAPHDALIFALGYLGAKDLLAVERVCRSFRDAVRSDPLLWRTIQIEPPLSEKITDDSLVKLTSRAQGILQCLSLSECSGITNGGLRRVLESNPRLTKLCVPGCSRLTVEGILGSLRAFNSVGFPGIKCLRIGGLFDVTRKQFEELKSLLGADDNMQQKTCVPQYFCWGQFYLPCDDDRAIDIDACPKCQKLGLVYDCPAESCRAKPDTAQLCRSCRLCIPRCFKCGCCFQDCDFVETFSLDFFCLDCFKELLICEEKMELMGASSSKCTFLCQGTRYEICLCG